jgi:hypothetical protein
MGAGRQLHPLPRDVPGRAGRRVRLGLAAGAAQYRRYPGHRLRRRAVRVHAHRPHLQEPGLVRQCRNHSRAGSIPLSPTTDTGTYYFWKLLSMPTNQDGWVGKRTAVECGL